MATLQVKRSTTPGAAPVTSDLVAGELAVNVNDGRLFMERNSGSPEIVCIGRPITISSSAPSGGQDGDIWFQYVP